jgi:hypothetical protein
MRSPGRYRAVNATHEGIHNDDVAAALGYRGGLVTGHAIISCVMDHAQAHWPGRWTSAGSLRMWFGRPVYDGDDMYVIVDDDGTVAVTTDSTDSSPRATGKIADLDQSVFSGSRRAFPAAPPAPRWLTPEVAATTDTLGSIEFVVEEEAYREQLAAIGLAPPRSGVVDAAGIAYIYRQYVPHSRANFTTDQPVIHIGAELEWQRPVAFGERISVRGRVDRAYSRRGVNYLVSDLAWCDENETPVLRAIHTVIYARSPERMKLTTA